MQHVRVHVLHLHNVPRLVFRITLHMHVNNGGTCNKKTCNAMKYVGGPLLNPPGLLKQPTWIPHMQSTVLSWPPKCQQTGFLQGLGSTAVTKLVPCIHVCFRLELMSKPIHLCFVEYKPRSTMIKICWLLAHLLSRA